MRRWIGLGLAAVLALAVRSQRTWKLEEVAVAVNKNDTDALLANGRFLEDRFGSSSLNLPAAGEGAS